MEPDGPSTSTVIRTMDANEAVAHVAYRASEVIAIYPGVGHAAVTRADQDV